MKPLDPPLNEEQAAFLAENVSGFESAAEYYPYSLPQYALRFQSMEQLVAHVNNSGSKFFSSETLKWWNSKINMRQTLIVERFFVTSERGPDGEPTWSVRWVYGAQWVPGEAEGMQGRADIGRFDQWFLSNAQARRFGNLAQGILGSLFPKGGRPDEPA